MYCSSCGVAVNDGLTYCNYCGAKLNQRDREKSPEVKAYIITMMVATFVFGTFVITLLMGMMKAVLHLDPGQILGFAALCFLVMLVLEGVFISLLFRRREHAKSEEKTLSQNRATTRELETESRVPLEPVASVTDQTTRTLTPVYGERK